MRPRPGLNQVAVVGYVFRIVKMPFFTVECAATHAYRYAPGRPRSATSVPSWCGLISGEWNCGFAVMSKPWETLPLLMRWNTIRVLR